MRNTTRIAITTSPSSRYHSERPRPRRIGAAGGDDDARDREDRARAAAGWSCGSPRSPARAPRSTTRSGGAMRGNRDAAHAARRLRSRRRARRRSPARDETATSTSAIVANGEPDARRLLRATTAARSTCATARVVVGVRVNRRSASSSCPARASPASSITADVGRGRDRVRSASRRAAGDRGRRRHRTPAWCHRAGVTRSRRGGGVTVGRRLRYGVVGGGRRRGHGGTARRRARCPAARGRRTRTPRCCPAAGW